MKLTIEELDYIIEELAYAPMYEQPEDEYIREKILEKLYDYLEAEKAK